MRFTVRGSSLQHRIKVAKVRGSRPFGQGINALWLPWRLARSTRLATALPWPQPPSQALLAAAPSLPGLQHVQRWVMAGHSMGARLAASLAGEQPAAAPVAACLLLSYPLHPPGKPDELRDTLLHQLHVPTLLVRGDRDPFSNQHKWDAALQGMPPDCAWQQHTVEGGDHGLKVGGKDGAARTAAAQRGMCAAVQQFVREAPQAGHGQEQQRQQPHPQQQPQQGRRQGRATAEPGQGTPASSSRGRPGRTAAATAQAGKKRSGVPAGADAASNPKKKAGKRQRRS